MSLPQVVVDHRVPRDTFYLLDLLYLERAHGPLLAMDALYWATHPDPLIHSWRWLQKDKPTVFVWVEDAYR